MRAAGFLERHQVVLYLGALVVGGAGGLLIPAVARPAELLVTPVLGMLLYATFLGVPLTRITRAFCDGRFLVAVLAVNFVAVPIVVFLVSRIVAAEQVLAVGIGFVLLTPCVDYVIAFTGLAGGAKDRLLAAAPLLMIVQIVALPLYLWLFFGAGLTATLDLGPFVQAFLLLIALPLLAAGLTQWLVRGSAGAVQGAAQTASAPLMALTLAVVVAAQIDAVRAHLGALALVVPVFVLFGALMVPIGAFAGRLARLDAPGRRALLFSGVTRNSLVVLPLVLALPAGFDLAPLVVVTQTLVELVVMVVLVRLVPRLIPARIDAAN